ncbi:cyclic nucleotide-binding domain-containing protein [Streptomyces hebeiensis]|uniref:Cyclic nucleotide-binding domain-containing protein n=1 Tax=Streptomyces hebeiensis TaxID=229486 RepID=A0ABP4F639_9ACTN
MTLTRNLFDEMPPDGRERLREIAREVTFPAGAGIFEEGAWADHFWIVRSGQVALHARVPGRRTTVVDFLGPGALLGWSWLFPPYTWHLGAEAVRRVEAEEYDATVVRALTEADPVFGRAMYRCVGDVVTRRLLLSRMRLLDL